MTNKRLLEPHDRQTESAFPEEAPFREYSGLNNNAEMGTELGVMLHHTAQSEGYETMTLQSSDIVSEVKYIYYHMNNFALNQDLFT